MECTRANTRKHFGQLKIFWKACMHFVDNQRAFNNSVNKGTLFLFKIKGKLMMFLYFNSRQS